MEPLAIMFVFEELTRLRYEQVWKNKNRAAVRDFWVNKLDAQERYNIIRDEEILLFVKLRELQNNECDCSNCDKKRQQLKNAIHQVYKEYLDDLKCFDDQDKSMIACEVMLSAETNHLRMTVNIETKEVYLDDAHRHTHQKEYYSHIANVFCLFAARMLDKRIIEAYNEALILERQSNLIQEEEDEKKRILERKQRKSEHRKDVLNKKRLLKQQEQEKLLEEQKQKELEEAKANQEKERQAQLKRQAKQELREKQKLELEQQRTKSYAKLKKRKERDAMLKKKNKSKTVTLPPSPTTTSYETPTMMSPASQSTEVTASTVDEEFLGHDKGDACMSPIGCFQLPVMPTPDNKSNHSFFLPSWMDHITALGDDASHQKLSVNKSNIWSNGWHASTSVGTNFHHDLFKDSPMEKSNETIIEEAKHVYAVLDKISYAKYARIPDCYSLSYLLNMMHELLSNNAITMGHLRQALDASDAFLCELQQPQNIVTVQLVDPH